MNMTFNRVYSWLCYIFRLTVHQVVTDFSVIRITVAPPPVCNMPEKNVTRMIRSCNRFFGHTHNGRSSPCM